MKGESVLTIVTCETEALCKLDALAVHYTNCYNNWDKVTKVYVLYFVTNNLISIILSVRAASPSSESIQLINLSEFNIIAVLILSDSTSISRLEQDAFE